jgi:hypothetical protein
MNSAQVIPAMLLCLYLHGRGFTFPITSNLFRSIHICTYETVILSLFLLLPWQRPSLKAYGLSRSRTKNNPPHLQSISFEWYSLRTEPLLSSITLLDSLLIVLQLSPAHFLNRSSHPFEDVNSTFNFKLIRALSFLTTCFSPSWPSSGVSSYAKTVKLYWISFPHFPCALMFHNFDIIIYEIML